MKKIFVIGKHRSGTTWIANILANHKDIAAIQHKSHHGIHESGFFSHVMPYFGNLNNEIDYIVFLEAFFASDYAIISGVTKELFSEDIVLNYFKFFERFMEIFAKQNNKNIWLEKTPMHTLYIDKINLYIKDAKFIFVKRETKSIVQSTINYKNNNNKFIYFRILRLVFSIIRYHKIATSFSKRYSNIMFVNYEEIKNNREKALKKICKFLEIKFQKSLLEDVYTSNTSYKNDKKIIYLNSLQSIYMSIIEYLARLFPTNLFLFTEKVYDIYKIIFRKNTLPKWFYQIAINKIHNKIVI
jgi:hypothetical protein